MAGTKKRRRRRRGSIEELPSGSLRVRVYSGVDPISKRQLYLTETIPHSDTAQREAEKALTRLLNQVDERRAPRTTANLNQLLDRYLEVLDVAGGTRRDYVSKIEKHIRPMLGSTPVEKIGTETLESLYADLRRCRDHCRGRRYIQHRTSRSHDCDEHGLAGLCKPTDPQCRACRRMCRPHQCAPAGRLDHPGDPLDSQRCIRPRGPAELGQRQSGQPCREASHAGIEAQASHRPGGGSAR